LQDCPNLEKVTLIELDFLSEDTIYIGDILYKNYPHFKILKLSGIFLDENIKYFFDGLKENRYIEELILLKMNLREDSILYLLNGLKNNIYLRILDISNNPIGEAVKYFCEDADYFNNISTIKLNNCDITDNYLEFILKSIELNKSIKTLELNINNITNYSKEYFISFFRLNNTLTKIYLLKNKINRRGISSSIKSKDLIKMVLES